MSSGVHGIEGFAGSAVQQMFMQEMLGACTRDDLGIMIIHGISPYGFRHRRRFTENNVDLNRNCFLDNSAYATANPGYARFSSLINPRGKVDIRQGRHRFFVLAVARKLMRHSIQTMRRDIMRGQYEKRDGLFYGGKEQESPIRALLPQLRTVLERYPMVLLLDLHTGHGKRGELHLFLDPIDDARQRALIEDNLFRGYPIDWGDEKGFYQVTGAFADLIKSLGKGKTVIPMTFEYGTIDNHKVRGSIAALHRAVLENQGFNYGYARPADETIVKARFLELFYPSAPTWRSAIMSKSRDLLRVTLDRYNALQ